MTPTDSKLDERLMIFGGSTRAAAQSAVRAGFRPLCADRFADEDLRETADILPLDRYPHGLVALAAQSPRIPWIYTGALENRPRLLRKLMGLRLLLGNPPDVVRAVRDPFRVHSALKLRGLPALPVRPGTEPPAPDGDWLLKPRRGSAGRGIRVWDKTNCGFSIAEPAYFQQRVAGRSISALYLATSEGTVMVGAAEQLIGVPELFGRPFAYCGSAGPLALEEASQLQILQTGMAIAKEFGLRGLFGVDFVHDADRIAWPTEVNPRYTASVEIYEWALAIPLLGWHCQACEAFGNRAESARIAPQLADRLDAARSERGEYSAVKGIVYAPFRLRVPHLADLARSAGFASSGMRIADRPTPGTLAERGVPVCTLVLTQMGRAALDALEGAISELSAEFGRNRLD